jgi:hypothetical protein
MTHEVNTNGEATHSTENKEILVNAGWKLYPYSGTALEGWAKGEYCPRFTIGDALQIAASDAYYKIRAGVEWSKQQ